MHIRPFAPLSDAAGWLTFEEFDEYSIGSSLLPDRPAAEQFADFERQRLKAGVTASDATASLSSPPPQPFPMPAQLSPPGRLPAVPSPSPYHELPVLTTTTVPMATAEELNAQRPDLVHVWAQLLPFATDTAPVAGPHSAAAFSAMATASTGRPSAAEAPPRARAPARSPPARAQVAAAAAVAAARASAAPATAPADQAAAAGPRARQRTARASTGKHRKPQGRAPKGKRWNADFGAWVPDGLSPAPATAEDFGSTKGAAKAAADGSATNSHDKEDEDEADYGVESDSEDEGGVGVGAVTEDPHSAPSMASASAVQKDEKDEKDEDQSMLGDEPSRLGKVGVEGTGGDQDNAWDDGELVSRGRSHPQVVLEDDDEDDAPYDAAESMPPAWDQWDDWVDPTAEQEAPPACAPTAPMAAARAPSAVLAPPSLATFPRAPCRAPLPPSPSRPAQLHVDQKGLLPSPNAARTTPQARIAHLSGDLSWIESLHDGSGMKSLGGTAGAPAGAAPRPAAAPHSLAPSANGFFGGASLRGSTAPAAMLPSAPAAAPPVVLPASSEPPPPVRYSSLSACEHATWVQLEKQREGKPGSIGSGLSALEEAAWAVLAKRVHKEQAEYAAWWWAHANAERPTRYGRIDHEVEIEVDHWLRARAERAVAQYPPEYTKAIVIPVRHDGLGASVAGEVTTAEAGAPLTLSAVNERPSLTLSAVNERPSPPPPTVREQPSIRWELPTMDRVAFPWPPTTALPTGGWVQRLAARRSASSATSSSARDSARPSVSRDPTMAALARQWRAHVAMASSAFVALLTRLESGGTSLDLPVLIKKDPFGNSSTIFLDKPLTPPRLSARHKNVKFFSAALRSAFADQATAAGAAHDGAGTSATAALPPPARRATRPGPVELVRGGPSAAAAEPVASVAAAESSAAEPAAAGAASAEPAAAGAAELAAAAAVIAEIPISPSVEASALDAPCGYSYELVTLGELRLLVRSKHHALIDGRLRSARLSRAPQADEALSRAPQADGALSRAPQAEKADSGGGSASLGREGTEGGTDERVVRCCLKVRMEYFPDRWEEMTAAENARYYAHLAVRPGARLLLCNVCCWTGRLRHWHLISLDDLATHAKHTGFDATRRLRQLHGLLCALRTQAAGEYLLRGLAGDRSKLTLWSAGHSAQEESLADVLGGLAEHAAGGTRGGGGASRTLLDLRAAQAKAGLTDRDTVSFQMLQWERPPGALPQASNTFELAPDIVPDLVPNFVPDRATSAPTIAIDDERAAQPAASRKHACEPPPRATPGTSSSGGAHASALRSPGGRGWQRDGARVGAHGRGRGGKGRGDAKGGGRGGGRTAGSHGTQGAGRGSEHSQASTSNRKRQSRDYAVESEDVLFD